MVPTSSRRPQATGVPDDSSSGTVRKHTMSRQLNHLLSELAHGLLTQLPAQLVAAAVAAGLGAALRSRRRRRRARAPEVSAGTDVP